MISNNYNAASFCGIKKASTTKAIAVAAMAALTGCQEEAPKISAFHKTSPKEIISGLDSSFKILDSIKIANPEPTLANPKYVAYHTDTLDINSTGLRKNPKAYMGELTDFCKEQIPESCIDVGNAEICSNDLVSSTVKPYIGKEIFQDLNERIFMPIKCYALKSLDDTAAAISKKSNN